MLFLTIAIPVFNQCDDLTRTLESIWQVDLVENPRVEILVSDNCSSDATKDVAHDWDSRYSNVQAFYQSKNLGFSGNFDFLATHARGTYIWVVGAGDELTGNGITNLLSLIEQEKPDWVVLNGNYTRRLTGSHSEVGCIGESRFRNDVPLFNHAVSLNIMKTKIARLGVIPGQRPAKSSRLKRRTTMGKSDIWEGESRFWPHLDSIAGYLFQNSEQNLRWIYFNPKSVHLDMNEHGSWDRGFSAMKVYIQWVGVVKSASMSCRNSDWLQSLSLELENMHLVRMLFLVRKDGNIPRRELYSAVRSIGSTLPLYKILARLVILTPVSLARLLAATRGQVLKASKAFGKNSAK